MVNKISLFEKYVGLKNENEALTAKYENLELKVKSSDEKIKTLEVCLYEFINKFKQMEKSVKEKTANDKVVEERIGDLETQINELVSKDISTVSEPTEVLMKNNQFKEVTLERLTALENKIHDMTLKIDSDSAANSDKLEMKSQQIKLVVEERAEDVITYCQFPPNSSGTISVTNEDYMCLGSSQFLNDVIIDFFLKYLQFSNIGIVDDNLMSKTHIFTTFFFKRLTTKPSPPKGSTIHPIEDNPDMTDSQKVYERVRKWTKKVDLFEKDFIVVPINDKAHWYVCIICYSGEEIIPNDETKTHDDQTEQADKRIPCILVFDSLPDGSKSDICNILRTYLTMEWEAKVPGKTKVFTELNMPQYNPSVRGQKNSKDCGIFLLQYVESFFRTRTRDWCDDSIEHMDWFPKEEVMKKRGKIAKLVRDLAVKQHYERKSHRKLVFPPLDFRSVESPVKKPKLTPNLTPVEHTEEHHDNLKSPVYNNTHTQDIKLELKSSEEVPDMSDNDASTRDPRLLKAKGVLFHKKGNKVSVSQCKANVVKRCGEDFDLIAKKIKTTES